MYYNLCLLNSCLSSLMFSKDTAIVVAMDKEVLHWRCIFSFAMSCFAVKFIGRGPKWYKNRCWFFRISSPEKFRKSDEFFPEVSVGTLCICLIVNMYKYTRNLFHFWPTMWLLICTPSIGIQRVVLWEPGKLLVSYVLTGNLLLVCYWPRILPAI